MSVQTLGVAIITFRINLSIFSGDAFIGQGRRIVIRTGLFDGKISTVSVDILLLSFNFGFSWHNYCLFLAPIGAESL